MEVKEIDNLDGIKEKWTGLMKESKTATTFQHPSWIHTWRKHFVGATNRVLLLGAYLEEMLVGIGVFERNGDRLEFLGMRRVLGQEISDYGDIVAKAGMEEDVWREMLRFMIHDLRFTNFKFDYVREKSPSFGVIKTLANEMNMRLELKKREVSPYLELPASFEVYLESLKKKQRHELKRKMRRVEETGVAQLKVITDGLEELQKRELIEMVKKSSEKKREFMTGKMTDFFMDMMGSIFHEQIGIIFFLEIDRKVVAAVLGFRFNQHILAYNGGFDPGINQPTGVALTGKMIEWAIANGFKRLDFLRGGERYKYDLGAVDQQLWQLTVSSR